MEKEWVMNALKITLQVRQLQKALLHHSDQGSRYASNIYQNLLRKPSTECSMSRKGNCYDNAVVESLFATLQQELVYHQHYPTRKEAKQNTFEYIQLW